MGKSKSSQSWLGERHRDQFVKLSKDLGLRSRSAFKLSEIQRRDRLLGKGATVIDLGAAPGGWAEFAAAAVGSQGRVIAVDITPMVPLSHVEFIRGDFRDQEVLDALLVALRGQGADVVLSDMSPNISGMRTIDQAQAMALAELALDLARQILRPGGSLLVKVFQGQGVDQYRRELQGFFQRVRARKPAASRGRSREFYLLGQNHQM